jgi:hypothetical protein
MYRSRPRDEYSRFPLFLSHPPRPPNITASVYVAHLLVQLKVRNPRPPGRSPQRISRAPLRHVLDLCAFRLFQPAHPHSAPVAACNASAAWQTASSCRTTTFKPTWIISLSSSVRTRPAPAASRAQARARSHVWEAAGTQRPHSALSVRSSLYGSLCSSPSGVIANPSPASTLDHLRASPY